MPQVLIQGPEGRLEGRYAASPLVNQPLALIMHPHPKYGGTMNNKVVYNLYQTFQQRGFSVLRFNFRGVGMSQGHYDGGIGELTDAATAMDWLQNNNKNAGECWVVGFSFGAWIAMQLLMRRPEIVQFVSIAPPANMFDFSFLAPCPSSGLILNGTDDKIVPSDHVYRLVDKLKVQRGIRIEHETLDGANHFFEDQIDDLNQMVASYIDRNRASSPSTSFLSELGLD
jgi:uncharacterized protein